MYPSNFCSWEATSFLIFFFLILFFVPPASSMQSWYFSLSAGMPFCGLLSTLHCSMWSPIDTVGVVGVTGCGQRSLSQQGYRLSIGSTTVMKTFRGAVTRWNTSRTQPKAFLLCSAAVSSLVPGSAFPQERAVEPAHAPRSPPDGGGASVPSSVPWETQEVSGSRTTDFIQMLETRTSGIWSTCLITRVSFEQISLLLLLFDWKFSLSHIFVHSHTNLIQ